jgi:hypothetical protein
MADEREEPRPPAKLPRLLLFHREPWYQEGWYPPGDESTPALARTSANCSAHLLSTSKARA